MKQQSGFTLIELIMVIVILGILAATALPKFANLAGDARIAVLNGAKGSLASTAAMAHGKYLVAATPPLTALFEGTTVTFATAVVSGYPKADLQFPTAAGLTSADFTIIGGTGLIVGATATAPGASATEVTLVPNSVAGTAAAVTCFVRYTEPTTTTSPPVVGVTSTTC